MGSATPNSRLSACASYVPAFGGQKHLVTSSYKPLHLTLPPVTASYCNLPQFTAIYRDIPPPGNSVALGRLRGFVAPLTPRHVGPVAPHPISRTPDMFRSAGMQLNWVGMPPTFRAKGATNLKSAIILKNERIQ